MLGRIEECNTLIFVKSFMVSKNDLTLSRSELVQSCRLRLLLTRLWFSMRWWRDKWCVFWLLLFTGSLTVVILWIQWERINDVRLQIVWTIMLLSWVSRGILWLLDHWRSGVWIHHLQMNFELEAIFLHFWLVRMSELVQDFDSWLWNLIAIATFIFDFGLLRRLSRTLSWLILALLTFRHFLCLLLNSLVRLLFLLLLHFSFAKCLAALCLTSSIILCIILKSRYFSLIQLLLRLNLYQIVRKNGLNRLLCTLSLRYQMELFLLIIYIYSLASRLLI
jgi:hypothetical protein